MQNYKCDACFGERNYGNYLEGEELFLCTQKMKLKHLEDVHNPDKPYLCAEKDCFRCFDTNERLSDHSYICLHVLDRITTEENRQRIIIGADTQRQLMVRFGGSHSGTTWDEQNIALNFESNQMIQERKIPFDTLKTSWGFTGEELEKFLLAKRGTSKQTPWCSFLKLSGNQGFHKYCQLYGFKSSDDKTKLLQQVLMLFNRSSELLPSKLRSIYTSDELAIILKRYNLLDLTEIRKNSEKIVSWNNEASSLVSASDKFKTLSKKGEILKKCIISLATLGEFNGGEFNQIHIANVSIQDKSPKRRCLPGRSPLFSNQILQKIQKDKLKDDDFAIECIGEETPIKTMVVTRVKKVRGGYVTTKVNRSVFGRYIPITHSIAAHIKKLESAGFNFNYEQIYLSFWMDLLYVNCLQSLFAIDLCISMACTICNLLVLNRKLFREIQTWISVPMKENKKDFNDILKDLLKIEIESLPRNVTMRLYIADNKCIQLTFGINNGNFPCIWCYICRKVYHIFKKHYCAAQRTIELTCRKANEATIETICFGDKHTPLFAFLTSGNLHEESDDGDYIPRELSEEEEEKEEEEEEEEENITVDTYVSYGDAGCDSLYFVENSGYGTLKFVFTVALQMKLIKTK